MKTHEEQLAHLAAALDEYTCLDDRVDRDALLNLILNAVLLPLDQQPCEIRRAIPGTDEFRIWRTPDNQMTPEEERLSESWPWHSLPQRTP